jgi:hypothetical protein
LLWVSLSLPFRGVTALPGEGFWRDIGHVALRSRRFSLRVNGPAADACGELGVTLHATIYKPLYASARRVSCGQVKAASY